MNATEIINVTALMYNANVFNFDVNVSPFLNDALIRQDIVKITTGKKLPTKVCTVSFTANKLKAFFEQSKLF